MSATDRRRRYAVVGTGGRAGMYIDAIANRYADDAVLVGLCDISGVRMAAYNARIAHKYRAAEIPTYHAERFDEMLTETRPDVVIVTTVDAFHHEYVVRALEHGCDAVTEKPMTTTAPHAADIFAALERTGQSLRVGFNYRYAPGYSMVREVVASGAIGRPQLVDFAWTLDTIHGADYFRRWHRQKECSGGLLVHKAGHHFDLINWWVASRADRVYATGGLRFYGAENATARGEHYGYDRYTGVAEAQGDPFALDLGVSRSLRSLYLEAEAETGYVRDQNVFGTGINIEDTMAVTASYRNGVSLSYSLVAYSPSEGMRVEITGDRGRLVLEERHRTHIIGAERGDVRAHVADQPGQSLMVQPMFEPARDVEIPRAIGSHGGGDAVMLDDLLLPDPPADPLGRAASYVDGAAALVIGVAANESLETGQAVRCDDLLPLP